MQRGDIGSTLKNLNVGSRRPKTVRGSSSRSALGALRKPVSHSMQKMIEFSTQFDFHSTCVEILRSPCLFRCIQRKSEDEFTIKPKVAQSSLVRAEAAAQPATAGHSLPPMIVIIYVIANLLSPFEELCHFFAISLSPDCTMPDQQTLLPDDNVSLQAFWWRLTRAKQPEDEPDHPRVVPSRFDHELEIEPALIGYYGPYAIPVRSDALSLLVVSIFKRIQR